MNGNKREKTNKQQRKTNELTKISKIHKNGQYHFNKRQQNFYYQHDHWDNVHISALKIEITKTIKEKKTQQQHRNRVITNREENCL